MDDEYIEAVAKLLAAEADARHRTCERCGGSDVIVAAVPLDPSLGAACIPVTYCRYCDADASEAAEIFAAFDEVKGQGLEPPQNWQE